MQKVEVTSNKIVIFVALQNKFMYSISIVIPNFNGLNLLQENIPATYEAIKTSKITDFEIIVADDASTDGSIEFLQSNYPNVTIVRNVKNQGFAGNINSGIRAASKDLVLALNSDVQLTPYYFTAQLPYFDKSDTFGVMGRIISIDGAKIQDGAKYPDYKFTRIGSTKNYTFNSRTQAYTLFLSGANALMDRKKLLFLGGFSELFNPYYGEDVDLGLTAWQCGYKCYYEHSAVCRHPNSATIKKEPSAKVKLVTKRNKIILHYLHLTGFECFCFMLKTLCKTAVRLLVGNTLYLLAFKRFASMFGKIKKRKEWLNLNKQYGLKKVIKLIKADIKKDDSIVVF